MSESCRDDDPSIAKAPLWFISNQFLLVSSVRDITYDVWWCCKMKIGNVAQYILLHPHENMIIPLASLNFNRIALSIHVNWLFKSLKIHFSTWTLHTFHTSVQHFWVLCTCGLQTSLDDDSFWYFNHRIWKKIATGYQVTEAESRWSGLDLIEVRFQVPSSSIKAVQLYLF